MNNTVNILVTHSSYADVCENFISLYKKNWADSPYDFIAAVIGENIELTGIKTVYCGENCTLPGAIYNVMHDFKYDYCISFLGDAFINKKIDNKAVNNVISDLINNNINYCCLVPKLPYHLKAYKMNESVRFISSKDIYNMSFVAFFASAVFVENEFSNNITDMEFELKYLREDRECSCFSDRTILTKNIFNIVPGIEAGKWNRHALRKLVKKNKDIIFTKREKVSKRKTFFNDIAHLLQHFFSREQRKFIKNIISGMFKVKFSSKY